MTIDVKLTALDHQTFRNVKDRMPLEIEALVETAASVVDTDGAPKRQGLALHPCQHWHQRTRQGEKVPHRPSYPNAAHTASTELTQPSTNSARFPPAKRKPFIPALRAHWTSLSLSPIRK